MRVRSCMDHVCPSGTFNRRPCMISACVYIFTQAGLHGLSIQPFKGQIIVFSLTESCIVQSDWHLLPFESECLL